MGQLTYARYALFDYALPERQDEPQYQELQRAGAALRGLMRVMLFKRFESSVEAFRQTVNRLRHLQRAFQGALDRGLVPAGDEATDILYKSDLDDELSLYEALERASTRYPIADFDVPKLQTALDTDIMLLDEMACLVEPIGPQEDSKLQQLISMMTTGRTRSSRRPLPGDLLHGKVLIFTQYADTAHYLYDNLKHLGSIRAVESDTKDRGRIILRFAPKANNYQLRPGDEELRILVSTDVLSEGLNLQDANHVINYDLHWNPIRLIQRVGRVDRIGTEHTTVYAYNFLPSNIAWSAALPRSIAPSARTPPSCTGASGSTKRPCTPSIAATRASWKKNPKPRCSTASRRSPPCPTASAVPVRRLASLACSFSARPGAISASTWLTKKATAQPILSRPSAPFVAKKTSLHWPCRLASMSASPPSSATSTPRSAPAHRVGSALGRDYALAELRLVFEAEEDPEEKARLALLSEIFASVPLTARAHRELNTLRRSKITGQALVAQLLRIVRDYNLEEAHRAIADRAEEVVLIPRIVCSEAHANEQAILSPIPFS